jgi:hypothetical protein
VNHEHNAHKEVGQEIEKPICAAVCFFVTDANEVVLESSAHVFGRPVLAFLLDEVRQAVQVVQRGDQAALAVREKDDAFHGEQLSNRPHGAKVAGANAVKTYQAIHGPPNRGRIFGEKKKNIAPSKMAECQNGMGVVSAD